MYISKCNLDIEKQRQYGIFESESGRKLHIHKNDCYALYDSTGVIDTGSIEYSNIDLLQMDFWGKYNFTRKSELIIVGGEPAEIFNKVEHY